MSPRPRMSTRRRVVTWALVLVVLAGVGLANRPVIAMGTQAFHNYQIGTDSYKKDNGFWSFLNVPGKFKINGIHSALLPTGKVLIVAGSGNNRANFNAGTFKTVVWNPADDSWRIVATPSDLFCSGHAFLPDGKLLIAGGTRRYEILKPDVKKAAGAMDIRMESPNGKPRLLRKGTELTSTKTGLVYRTTADAIVPPATKVTKGPKTVVTASITPVYVEALTKGKAAIVKAKTRFTIKGLTGQLSRDWYGVSQNLNMNKQEYQGDDTSYEFNPYTETYEKTGKLNYARWYPTLAPLADGSVLAVSGLNNLGNMINGQIEKFDVKQKRWIEQPRLKQMFPTYPALFLMKNNELFFSGSNTGYGSPIKYRKPGIWNLRTNALKLVPGLTDTDLLETSASVLLAPAQDQKVMLLGGGGTGQSDRATRRTAVIDLDSANPEYKQTADLPNPTRYLGTVLLPDDTVFTTNGSTGYRGENDSDLLTAQIYHPDTNKFDPVAPPKVGRNYHSESILLPDGRVLTLGSDPLYAGNGDYRAGKFEQRIEIYTPAYLYKGKRPTITGGPAAVRRGETVTFTTSDAADLKSARLIRPSSVTHVTDVEQRSLALDMTPTAGGVQLTIPQGAAMVPSGNYMLFLNNKAGVPSVARWVKVA
jgi:hypothetical protein